MMKNLFSRNEPERQRRTNQSGFTLIEMLVVISVIALLAAILFPVFARARENARRASCLSNTKQLGLSALMYTQDYDERLPPSYNLAGATWLQLLQPYVKSNQIFFCPSDSIHKLSSTTPISGSNVSYGWNFWKLTHNESTSHQYEKGGISLAAIAVSSQTVMLGDSQGSVLPYVISSPLSIIPNPQTYVPQARHLGGANFCFVDGHSKWFIIPGVITKDGTLWRGTGKP